MQNAKKALQNAPSPSDEQGDEKPTDASEGILEAFAKDTSEAGKAVAELLKNPTPEAASALIERLPDLLKGDMETAAVLEKAMAEAFVKEDM